MDDREGQLRLGVIGGTFNPIHTGHLLIAESAREQFQLDRVLFIPVNIPPHKKFQPEVSGADRLKMVECAVRDNPFFIADPRELHRAGPSRSYDTVVSLREDYPAAELFYIIGADNAVILGKWFNINSLLQMVTFVAAPRPGENKRWHPAVVRLDVPPFGISSTTIRDRSKSGNSIRYLVPEPVRSLILHKGWYR